MRSTLVPCVDSLCTGLLFCAVQRSHQSPAKNERNLQTFLCILAWSKSLMYRLLRATRCQNLSSEACSTVQHTATLCTGSLQVINPSLPFLPKCNQISIASYAFLAVDPYNQDWSKLPLYPQCTEGLYWTFLVLLHQDSKLDQQQHE